ncbi:ATP-binding protein [uncultured Subdoligranulum sp.]|uniref:ATP-binding protein n=1 Tax=uncultured Subdoligranulum sp. TaxID=512298 RepID=UPI0025DFE22D|nr:ATP-binding protein [uncultured Subdoligranulum sp.]
MFCQGGTSRKTEGSGLGLAMVKKIVALHEGTVAVQTEPGVGSTFTVCLPKWNRPAV